MVPRPGVKTLGPLVEETAATHTQTAGIRGTQRVRQLLTAMDKAHIIREIRRTAEANGGVGLGWRRFEEETGIRYYDWYGKFWTRWSDAVREAGFEPNRMSEAYDDGFLLEKLVLIT